ncbi:MAG: sensor histidine kinase [Chloroflexi bacterium]|nr:sensor histidine kinase [Chloroflexota bacterium]
MILFGSLLRRYQGLHHRNPYLTPGVITLFLTVFLVQDLRIEPLEGSGYEQEDLLGVLLALGQVLPLLLIVRAPFAALSVIFVAFLAHASLGFDVTWIAQFTTFIAIYQVTSATNDRQSIAAGALTFGVIIAVFGVIREDIDSTFALLLLFAAVWVAGNVVRSRRGRLEIAELTVAELSEEQERSAREATNEERARIARELHDVVGHALNLVVIQAGAAQRVFEASPEKALETVKSIESTSRQALSDVDRMLGILRDPDATAGAGPSLEARPSMKRLESLVEEIRATGQPVDLTIKGGPTALAPSVDLSAFRVVQEALTNVITHAAGARAQVMVEYSESKLSVIIVNDGTGTDTRVSRQSGGRGVVGMRERTGMFGGEFEAGKTEDGGWRVHATFLSGGLK